MRSAYSKHKRHIPPHIHFKRARARHRNELAIFAFSGEWSPLPHRNLTNANTAGDGERPFQSEIEYSP